MRVRECLQTLKHAGLRVFSAIFGVALYIPPDTALPRRVPARYASYARLQANKFALH